MPRKGEFLCVVAGLMLLSFPLKKHLERSREMARRGSCQNNLKLIAIGFKLYSNDYDGCYPLTAVTNSPISSTMSPYGWFDALQPYIRGTQVNYCPSAPQERHVVMNQTTSVSGVTDYWFSSNLAGVSWKQLTLKSCIITAGDGNDGLENTNARFHRNSLPPNYAPATRHLGGANYSFVDGHVKWLLPSEVTTAPAATGNYTFAIR